MAQAQDSASSGSDQDDENEEGNAWSPQWDRGASRSGPLATPGPALAVEPGCVLCGEKRTYSPSFPLTGFHHGKDTKVPQSHRERRFAALI